MKRKILSSEIIIVISILALSANFSGFQKAAAAPDDCPSGYKFNPRSGVGCQQENCNTITDAHYSYVGDCICGSSGSMYENPDDPNKECYLSLEDESCPGCLYACVGLKEECPGAGAEAELEPEPIGEDGVGVSADTADAGIGISADADTSAPDASNNANPDQSNTQSADAADSLSTLATVKPTGRTCEQECKRLTAGGKYDEVLEAKGTYPDCRCTVDNKDKDNRLTQTILQNGDKRTIFTFDPKTGAMIKKETISIMAVRERIRKQLGYKYDEDQIDRMLADDVIEKWFADKMKNIKTATSLTDPQFWYQHFVAWLDHGYGNSTDFVDTYNFGRCGDSMMWLEEQITASLKLNGKRDKKSEAVLSITGEKYNNTLNHTSLFVRPPGYSNIAWADTVNELIAKTRQGGLTEADIKAIDPALLDAKVLDPYFRKTTTVREFIKGWSVIKIS